MTFKQIESGRSMVEMLGTLAIIGVLSIGGIMGYSYGMDKYRANETMRDISLRTVDLITQASQGHAALSLSEWENEDSIYDFTNPAYVEGENLIVFDVGATKKLPKSVCQMVFDGVSNTAVQIDINAVHSNSNEDCGTDNTMTFYFEGGGNGTGGETSTGEQCGDTVCGTCQKCYASTETCVTVSDYEAKCTVDGQSGWCVGGACEPDPTCNCEAGQYCADKNTSGGSCDHPTPSGECKDAKTQFREVDIAGTTYYISNSAMSWWDAVSACEALGNKRLLTVEDLVVRNDNDTIRYTNTVHEKTAIGKALYEQGVGSNAFSNIWSSILSDSCNAYYLNLVNGIVYSTGRNVHRTSYTYAVCR